MRLLILIYKKEYYNIFEDFFRKFGYYVKWYLFATVNVIVYTEFATKIFQTKFKHML